MTHLSNFLGCLKQWLLDTDIYDIHNTNDLHSTIFSTEFLEILNDANYGHDGKIVLLCLPCQT